MGFVALGTKEVFQGPTDPKIFLSDDWRNTLACCSFDEDFGSSRSVLLCKVIHGLRCRCELVVSYVCNYVAHPAGSMDEITTQSFLVVV